MPRRLPSLKALKALEVLSRHLNLGKAAEELFVTPAAVNQLIKSLEDELGVTLFNRARRQYSLTREAEAGLPELRQGFDLIADSIDKMCQSASHAQVSVSVAASFAAIWLVPRLERFRREHTDIDVFLEVSSEVKDLSRESIDMAIRYGPGDYPDLDVTELFREEFFPVCSPDLVRAPAALQEPEDLRQQTLLHVDWAPSVGHWPTWKNWFDVAGIEHDNVDHGPRFSHQHLAYQAAAHGQGVALGSTALVADDLATGRLVRPFGISVSVDWGYYVVCRPGRAEEPTISAFRDWLLKESGHKPIYP